MTIDAGIIDDKLAQTLSLFSPREPLVVPIEREKRAKGKLKISPYAYRKKKNPIAIALVENPGHIIFCEVRPPKHVSENDDEGIQEKASSSQLLYRAKSTAKIICFRISQLQPATYASVVKVYKAQQDRHLANLNAAKSVEKSDEASSREEDRRLRSIMKRRRLKRQRENCKKCSVKCWTGRARSIVM